MRKMNEYERHAYLYSAWTALLVPWLVTIWVTWSSILPSKIDTIHMIQKTLEIVASSSVVYAAIGFYIRELFRSTSKMIFQFRCLRRMKQECQLQSFCCGRISCFHVLR